MSVTTPQRLPAREIVPRHDHPVAYAAFVIDGNYREAGDLGRYVATAGTVIIHTPFSQHSDEIGGTGARVINLPLRADASFRLASGRLEQPGLLLSMLEEGEAPEDALAAQAFLPLVQENDMPDRLALDLLSDPEVDISGWAARMNVAPRTLSRQFRRAYGVSASHFRWRARTRMALREIVRNTTPLAEIAHGWGFSDQAHLTRSIVAMTGSTPAAWRTRKVAV